MQLHQITTCHFVCDGHDAAAQEANAINKSLTFLEQTVNALSRKEGHVPFRQSKLTSLLRDALGGNCKTVCAAASVFRKPVLGCCACYRSNTHLHWAIATYHCVKDFLHKCRFAL